MLRERLSNNNNESEYRQVDASKQTGVNQTRKGTSDASKAMGKCTANSKKEKGIYESGKFVAKDGHRPKAGAYAVLSEKNREEYQVIELRQLTEEEIYEEERRRKRLTTFILVVMALLVVLAQLADSGQFDSPAIKNPSVALSPNVQIVLPNYTLEKMLKTRTVIILEMLFWFRRKQGRAQAPSLMVLFSSMIS